MTLAIILEDLHATADDMFTFAIGGAGFYFAKGVLRSSSKGCRIAGGVQAVVTNGPRVCRWAAWSGVLLTIDSVMVRTRDATSVQCPLNMAVAWGAANALFSVRRGTRAAVREGLKGVAYGGLAAIATYSIVRYPYSVKSSDC